MFIDSWSRLRCVRMNVAVVERQWASGGKFKPPMEPLAGGLKVKLH